MNDPGFIYNILSLTTTLVLWVCPDINISHPIVLWIIPKESISPHGKTWWPWIKPILKSPICIVFFSGISSWSKSPFTMWKSLERLLSQSYVSWFPMLPRHNTCWTLFGVKIDLNCSLISGLRWGRNISPTTKTNSGFIFY